MKIREKIRNMSRKGKIALAAGAVTLTGLTAWAGVILLAGNSDPTILLRCMDFKLRPDGSIQAYVRVSAENMYFSSTSLRNIQFNPDYIRPSYWDDTTNRQKIMESEDTFSTGVNVDFDRALWIDNAGDLTHPFAIEEGEQNNQKYQVVKGTSSKEGTQSNGRLTVTFNLSNEKIQSSNQNHPVIKGVPRSGTTLGDTTSSTSYAINGTGEVFAETGLDNYNDDGTFANGQAGDYHGVNLASLSFWVDPDNLSEMVTKFKQGNQGSNFLIGFIEDGNGNLTQDGAWSITDYISYRGRSLVSNQRTDTNKSGNRNDTKNAQVIFDFIFPEVLVKADVAGGSELTVNAWQAFTSGTFSDIASTLQRYRPEILGTNADASEKHVVFNWGDTNSDYKVYRKAEAGETPDYWYDSTQLQRYDQWQANTGNTTTPPATGVVGWVEVDPTDPYNPKEGEYMVTQTFYYEEDGQTKTYPLPMRVHLTITPVTLVDANADKLSATYKQSDAQDTSRFPTNSLTGLGLPNRIVLSLSPVPGAVTLTMPVADANWQPNTIGGLTTTGTPAQVQNWPDVGVYTLNGPTKTEITDYVAANYLWVTLDDNQYKNDSTKKDIVATRTVVSDSGYTDVQYTAEYVSTSSDGALDLKVTKTKDGQADAFAGGTQFRTYLPGTTLIDTTDLQDGLPASGATNGSGASSATNISSDVGSLNYNPGTTIASRSDHQKDVARSINLGGWFYVSVSEDGGATWSNLIPVYVSPRDNFYIDYVNPGDGKTDYISTAPEYYNFDFSGSKAGVFPFYYNSELPTNVTLPTGYTVTTTYDGITGEEPGQLGQFRVAAWAAEEETATPPGATQQPWTPGAVVDYGDPVVPAPADRTDFIDSTTYGNYGKVMNSTTPADREYVHVKVQVPELDSTGTPNPAPTESILLTHGSNLPQGNTTNDDLSGLTWVGNEVSEVTYNTRAEGYVDRQTFTLVIKNNGNVPIYGLAVHTDYMNGDTTQHIPDGVPHFEIVQQPAAYLPVGGETTFTVTYVYNLFSNVSGAPETYRDHLVITSNNSNYNQLGNPTDSQNSYLKDFYAQFEVSKTDLFKVTVVTDPVNGSLGTAGIVKGLTSYTLPTGKNPGDTVNETGLTKRPDMNPGTSYYEGNYEYVWIHANPVGENAVKEVYYFGENNQKIPLYIYEYTKSNSADTDETVYFFKMPEMDVTVHVVFYEPILAKLRLSRLMGYAGTASDATTGNGAGTGTGLIDKTITNPTDLDKWVHTMRHNVRWYDTSTNIIQSDTNYYDIQCPAGHVAHSTEFQADGAMLGNVFCPVVGCTHNTTSFAVAGQTINHMTEDDSSRPNRPDYIMVLEDYANTTNAGEAVDDLTRVQLDVRLRENANAPDIDDVEVSFYDATNSQNLVAITSTPTQGQTWVGTSPTSGAPTSHHTAVFEAPAKPADGSVATKTIRITLSCTVTQDMWNYDPALQTKYPNYNVSNPPKISRSFDVVITRPGKEVNTFNYGNSPKGMIYNDSSLATLLTKGIAWDQFVSNGYSFVGVHTPAKASTLKNTYWKAAWGDNNYYDATANNGAGDYVSYNGDEDEYAIFAILGEPFQDSGLKAKNTAGLTVAAADMTRSVTVELLDSAATTQAGRFHGQRTNGIDVDTVTLDLGAGNTGLVTGTDTIDNWWEDSGSNTVYNIRPGIYDMVYTYTDYDGVTQLTATRKLIILSPVGDVNADRSVDTTDVNLIQNRIKDPLGCTIPTGTPDYPAWQLFRYRCCDTNNDRNINNIDSNKVKHASNNITAYYKPTDYRS